MIQFFAMTARWLPHLIIGALFVSMSPAYCANRVSVPIQSQHALMINEETGSIVLQKNPDEIVPIASLTKLMTAMVTLDANQNMEEMISIKDADVDVLKNSSSRVPVGTVLPRRELLHLALMSSDNRAAAALARTYPGGKGQFSVAMRDKLRSLSMGNTRIGEPTGLSPENQSSAFDLVKMARAASKYPEIVNDTTDAGKEFDINGQTVAYRNTNRLVGKNGWNILLSKTGYTKEAGRCIIMRIQSLGKKFILVLLNASGSDARTSDATNAQRYVMGETTFLSQSLHGGKKHLRRKTSNKASKHVVPMRQKKQHSRQNLTSSKK